MAIKPHKNRIQQANSKLSFALPAQHETPQPRGHNMPEIELNIPNEWGHLEAVVVGHGRSMGAAPTLDSAFDPTSKLHLSRGTYPDAPEVAAQLDGLSEMLDREGISVLRPTNLEDVEQVFARDVGLVIDSTFIRSRTIEARSDEWKGVAPILGDTPWTPLPEHVQMEGGDVVVLDSALFVGVTSRPDWMDLQVSRTYPSALEFLKSTFPHREVVGLELHKDDRDPLKCALHLDCAYMPLGGDCAIICSEAFVQEEQLKFLKKKHPSFIEVSLEEAALLQTNLLFTAPDTLVIDPRFVRLGRALEEKGFRLISCPLDKVGRMGGLFRCSTLPLRRS